MNVYIKAEITKIQFLLKNFEKSCELAAKKDDGEIDENEKKVIAKLKKATKKFCEQLERIE